jgi:hypothetical protein
MLPIHNDRPVGVQYVTATADALDVVSTPLCIVSLSFSCSGAATAEIYNAADADGTPIFRMAIPAAGSKSWDFGLPGIAMDTALSVNMTGSFTRFTVGYTEYNSKVGGFSHHYMAVADNPDNSFDTGPLRLLGAVVSAGVGATAIMNVGDGTGTGPSARVVRMNVAAADSFHAKFGRPGIAIPAEISVSLSGVDADCMVYY